MTSDFEFFFLNFALKTQVFFVFFLLKLFSCTTLLIQLKLIYSYTKITSRALTKYIYKHIIYSQNGTRRSRFQGETGRASGEVRLLCAFTRRALVFEGGFRATILIRFHFFLLRRDKKSTRLTTFHDAELACV